jgi:hypothetical protein
VNGLIHVTEMTRGTFRRWGTCSLIVHLVENRFLVQIDARGRGEDPFAGDGHARFLVSSAEERIVTGTRPLGDCLILRHNGVID